VKAPKRRPHRLFSATPSPRPASAPKGYVTLIKNALDDKHKDLGVEVNRRRRPAATRLPDVQRGLEKDVLFEKKPTLVVIYIGITDVCTGR